MNYDAPHPTQRRGIMYGVLLLLLLVVAFSAPLARAASYIVPCGNDIKVTESGNFLKYQGECTVCDLSVLGMNVLNFLIMIMIAVAALLFVQAGVLYVTSPANPGNVSRAHKIFTNTFIGIVIILLSYLLIDTVMRSLIAGSLDTEANLSTFGPWNQILCGGSTTQDVYYIPKISSLKLTASVLVLPKLDCAVVGGTCVANAAACTGTARTGTTCSGATPVCCTTTSTAGQSCSATVGSIKYPGYCYPSGCPAGQLSAASSDCTTGTCCYQQVSSKGAAIVACEETFKNQGCIYNQDKRNGCACCPGWTDCSDLVDECYTSSGCSSPGGTTCTTYYDKTTELVSSTDTATLKTGDAIVYRYSCDKSLCPNHPNECGHIVTCMNDGCSTVIHASGTGKDIVTSNASSYLSRAGAKVVRASAFCP